jgi:Domain of unknown function (DUF1996)
MLKGVTARSVAVLMLLTLGVGAFDADKSVSARPIQPPVRERDGSLRVECRLSHQARVDPIVTPGGVAHHMHDVFGNVSTAADSTYDSMRAAATTCSARGDRAGYWSPALVAPDGTFVQPERAIFYYRNRPAEYGPTRPFPPDFRMIAGGPEAFPNAYWTCDGEKDTALSTRRDFIPNCGAGGKIKLHVFFPSCWDGVRLDSRDHRSHVAYGQDSDGLLDATNPDLCPRSHPVKIPQLDYRVLFPVSNGRRHKLADGSVVPHADFWNTWVQSELDGWVQKCLWGGISCKLAVGGA